ncbi:MAG: hypothetical protein ACI9QL_001493 [Candidatus Omnitrophota bacterium]|jgi:hypothetical protein
MMTLRWISARVVGPAIAWLMISLVSVGFAQDPLEEQAFGTEAAARLASVQLPALEFSEATVLDLAQVLEEQLRQLDPALSLLVTAKAAAMDVAFTASLKAMNLQQLLELLAGDLSLDFRVNENVIVLDQGEERLKRFYSVDPSLIDERVSSSNGGFDDFGGGSGVDDLKELFTNYGLSFPPGTSIRYEPLTSQLVLIQTADNIERFEQIVNTIDGPRPQVEISGAFVTFALEDFKALGKLPENATTEELVALRKQGKGRLVQPFKIVTIPGINAVIENVTEIIYPTEFDVSDNGIPVSLPGGPGSVAHPFTSPVIPGAFETREIGQIINITPTLSPDNRQINLTLLPEVAELVGWREEGYKYLDHQGKELEMPMRMPIFKSRNVCTSMIVWDGQIVTVSGGYDAGRQTYTMLFVSARLIDFDGTAWSK